MDKTSVISEQMKDDLIKKQIAILDSIYEFCDQNNLKISLAYGTLLGAVRHKGYIPWDHDIDCMMPRKDFDYFCKNFKSDKGYFLQTNTTDSNFKWSFAKVRDSNTTFIEPFNIGKQMNQGIWVDIFPFDYVSNNSFLSWIQYKIVVLKIKFMNPLNVKAKPRKFLEFLFGHKVVLNSLVKLSTLCGKKGKLIADFSAGLETSKIQLENIFDKFIMLEFEGKQYRCIRDYDYYLTSKYGNYMKIPSGQSLDNELTLLSKCIIDPYKSYKEYL